MRIHERKSRAGVSILTTFLTYSLSSGMGYRSQSDMPRKGAFSGRVGVQIPLSYSITKLFTSIASYMRTSVGLLFVLELV